MLCNRGSRSLRLCGLPRVLRSGPWVYSSEKVRQTTLMFFASLLDDGWDVCLSWGSLSVSPLGITSICMQWVYALVWNMSLARFSRSFLECMNSMRYGWSALKVCSLLEMNQHGPMCFCLADDVFYLVWLQFLFVSALMQAAHECSHQYFSCGFSFVNACWVGFKVGMLGGHVYVCAEASAVYRTSMAVSIWTATFEDAAHFSWHTEDKHCTSALLCSRRRQCWRMLQQDVSTREAWMHFNGTIFFFFFFSSVITAWTVLLNLNGKFRHEHDIRWNCPVSQVWWSMTL